MNSLSPAAPAVKPLQFPVGTSIPYIWGAQDAAAGGTCTPEMVWVRKADQREYAAGWASVAGENETTRWFLKAN